MKNNFLLNKDQREVFETLSDGEAGQLIKGVFKYLDTGDSGLNGALKAIFIPIKKTIDDNEKKYQRICEKNKENIRKRWNKDIPNNTTVSSSKENDTTVYESIPNDTDNNHISYITNHNSNNIKEIKNIINNYHTNKTFNARELQLDFDNYLQNNGFKTRLEVKVDSNGSKDYKGFIDLVAKYKDKTIAIELDNVNPQGKSIYKLKNYDCDYRFIILRNNYRNYMIEDIEVIGIEERKINDYSNEIKQIIEHLNTRIGSNYKVTTKSTVDKIEARLKEGYKLDDFIVVIDKKTVEWINTDMQKYLRPETLFGTKFESYLNQPTTKKITTKDIAGKIDISDF